MPIPKRTNKNTYTLSALGSQSRGKKIIVYGASGMGKTTLSALAPKPAFMSIRGDSDANINPITGEQLHGIDVESFADARAILQSDVFDDVETIVIDHVTELQHLALPYTFKTVKTQNGDTASNIEDYGFHKGYRHWYDTMRLILQDCDRWVRKGKNIILIAQESISKSAQAGVEDFVKDGPELYHDKNVSILNSYVSWAEHVFRIEYSQLVVNKKGKANPVKTRQIRVHPDATFYAKSKTIPADYDVVTFEEPKDDSIWRLLFTGDK